MIWLQLVMAVAMMGVALMLGGAALGWLVARYRLHAVQVAGADPARAARTGPVFIALLVVWTAGWLVLSVLMAQRGWAPPPLFYCPPRWACGCSA
ncbi:MAG: hypothetical protein HND59_04780 [Pseudomonadota bacterium]|nr:MAG: hypothetical protein HND59_04780 [Pseudomonadota bacterium]